MVSRIGWTVPLAVIVGGPRRWPQKRFDHGLDSIDVEMTEPVRRGSERAGAGGKRLDRARETTAVEQPRRIGRCGGPAEQLGMERVAARGSVVRSA